MDLIIREDFKKLIPKLSDEEFRQLEENIVKEGVLSPLITWNNVIIDGHNRYEIATKYGLYFDVTEKNFKDDNDAKEWMILNQFGRRNLSHYQRSVLALELENLFKEKAVKNMQKGGGDKRSGCQNSDNPIVTVDTKKEVAKLAHVSHDTIAKVKAIEQKAAPEIKAKLNTGEVSIHQAYQEVKKEEKKQELEKKKTEYIERVEAKSQNDFYVDIYNTDEKFRIIYADPAWSYNDKQETPQLGGAAKHYDTMTVSQICDLPVNSIADKDSVLFLWVTSPLLEDAFSVIRSWGFKYKSSFIWDKVKHNMGHYNSVRHELLLIATKGSCVPDNKVLFDSVQAIERNDNHSEKPVEFINIIDSLYGFGNRIELFCRKIKKEGWHGWGNEI